MWETIWTYALYIFAGIGVISTILIFTLIALIDKQDSLNDLRIRRQELSELLSGLNATQGGYTRQSLPTENAQYFFKTPAPQPTKSVSTKNKGEQILL